jgi:hypothetical protein
MICSCASRATAVTFTGGTTGQSCNTCHNKPNGPENCTTCHGSVNAAPPKDLSDNISPASRGVGAHQKHLLGGIIGKAVACTECHTVPATLTLLQVISMRLGECGSRL